jgi:hypothetical protein
MSWKHDRARHTIGRVVADGYQEVEPGGPGVLLHRRKAQLSRFGMVDTLVSVRVFEGAVTQQHLLDHDIDAKDAALLHEVGLPRGLGSAVEVFPITIADDAAPGVREWVATNHEMDWSLISMRGLVAGHDVVVCQKTAVWGGAYIPGLRTRLQGWLAT